MTTLCDIHQKPSKFKCCHNDCSNLLCSDCLIHNQNISSAFFYCNICITKETDVRPIVICQPVTNASPSVSRCLQDEDAHEKDDLSTLRVELFPVNKSMESNNEDTESVFINEHEQSSNYNRTLVREVDNAIPEASGIIVLNDVQERVAIEPTHVHCTDDLPLAQTVDDNDADFLNVLHIPEWYIETMTSNRDSQSIHKDITKRCWITEDFSEEIRRFYPNRDEIRLNSTLGDCVRDLNAFKRKCAVLFPVGRVFLSKIQFDQAAKHFLDGWNCKKVHHGKKIRCFFSVSSHKQSYKSTCDPQKRRTITSSVKKQYECPFELRYSFLDMKRNMKLPLSFYKVKTTWCNYNHTCQLSSIFYKTATQLSRGSIKLDLVGMNSLIMLLKSNPATNARSLRSLLTEYVHHDVAIDCNYIRNFRQRVAYFHAANPSYTDLTINEANMLLEKAPLSEEEHKVLDNPIIRINFKEMLLKVMAEDSSTWETLAFLRRCKEEMPGFDFRIRLNERNHPCSLVFTTANGRSNAIRYGDVLSLDMQHRQHNKHNWPYFGPVIKTSDMTICIICEAIVISETLILE